MTKQLTVHDQAHKELALYKTEHSLRSMSDAIIQLVQNQKKKEASE